ncbi:unnamed protein product [Brassicogethes aeneus]|uniref:Myosin motor domain-containing protein n=1 Tax=Brassicogethes aeneus TaxID=1431903 RepID=A0A9P0BIY3_BRAAE|nr:unnamed protein product [Brassicogethes aeneus]
MSTLGIENVQEILKILSIILNLGNVEFKETDQGYKVAENSIIYFQNVCKLLACNETELFNLFTKRLLAAKSKRCTFCFSNCVTLEECEERKNTIMRFLYDGLFNWIVKKINDKTRSKIKCSNIGEDLRLNTA